MDSYRAHSLFQPSNLAKAAALTVNDSGECIDHLYGSVLMIPHTVVARTLAVLGFDYVMIDALHTAVDAEKLIQLIQTVNFTSEGKTVAVVRVPSADSDLLTHALDAGAAGIIFPHIDTPEQAAEAVKKCRYACSGGDRSLSPSALLAGITDIAPGTSHHFIADRNIAVICQIESSLGVENADKIAAVPGVNVIMVGPGDLRLSLGLTRGDKDEAIFNEALGQIFQAAKKYKLPVMGVTFKQKTTTDSVTHKYGLLICSADVMSIVKGQKIELLELKNALKRQEKSKI